MMPKTGNRRKILERLLSERPQIHQGDPEASSADRITTENSILPEWFIRDLQSLEKGCFAPSNAVLLHLSEAVSAGEENYHSGLTKRTSIPEADRMLEKWTGDRGFDPRPVLAESSVPMLWIFADRDRSVPTAASVAALKKVIADGNESHTIHVIPNCDHNYQNPETGDGFLLELVMIGWLRERGVLR